MKPLLPLAVAIALAVSGCASQSVPKVSLDAPVAQLAQQYTQVKKPELSGKRIVISSFGVEFQTRVKHSSTGGFGSTSSSSSILNLSGVSPATMQAITDEAYAELVKDLKAAGYEVVDGAEVSGNEDYQKLVSRATPSGEEITVQDGDSKNKSVFGSKSRVFSPAGKVWYRPSADEAGPRLGLGSVLGSIMRVPNKNYEADLAKTLKANVLKVYYVVGFGTAKSSTSGGYSGSSGTSHSQKAVAQLRIEGQGETRLAFRVPGKSLMAGFDQNDKPRDGHAIVSLSQNLVGENSDFLAGDVVNSTSLNNRVGNALSSTLNVMGALAGMSTGGTANTQEFTAPADEGLYRAAATKHLNLAGELLVYRLQQGK